MKKQLVVLGAAAIIAAAAVPALAFENEFHGSYRFMAYETNFFNGTTFGPAAKGSTATNGKNNVNGVLRKDASSGFFSEQRGRLQYIAKANDNLKMITQFELDTRFGGIAEGYKGTTGNDSGNLDADQLTLETKNVYLDFNCPITGTNVKVGMQPWADSYQNLFLLADMTGAIASKSFGPATATLGWFRFDDNTAAYGTDPGKLTANLLVLDGKFAINKDMKVGVSYYNIQNDTGASTAATATTADLTTGVVTAGAPAYTSATKYDLLHMIGVNADLKFGPASIKPFAAYQFGEQNGNDDISAYLLGAVAKVKVGPGAVNASAIYLSGDKDGTGKNKDFKTVSVHTSYFNPANMWLLVRNASAVNSSTSILGNDITVDGRGLFGLFAGYEGAVDKIFYNANLGYAQVAEKRAGEKSSIGTEVNAQVGYKLYDNLSASAAVAYAFLGERFDADQRSSVESKTATAASSEADNPWMLNLQLLYSF